LVVVGHIDPSTGEGIDLLDLFMNSLRGWQQTRRSESCDVMPALDVAEELVLKHVHRGIPD